ncbi:MAG: hypothetical protein HN341_19840 [Verrucomicrobia bacterium]|jgi:phage gpG-like protein|nr:hypothetical protein [Verrucomicrobiota bacterium]
MAITMQSRTGVGVFFQVEGWEKMVRSVLEAKKRAGDMGPIWELVATDFAAEETQVFAHGGAWGGYTAWAPVQEKVAKAKARQGFQSAVLVGSGRLKNSLTQRGHPEFRYEPTPLTLKLGTRVPYASSHDEGTTHLPQRSLIRITPQAQSRWASLMTQYITEAFESGR